MSMKIVILEDNADRCRTMRDCLADRFRHFELRFFDSPRPAREYLANHLPEVILISLDHDFDLVPDGQGHWSDPGTGREVADFLAEHTPTCPILVHSSNAAAASGMQVALETAGWTTHVVAPYDDLAWIREQWFPVVRRAIVDTARPVEGSLVRPLSSS